MNRTKSLLMALTVIGALLLNTFSLDAQSTGDPNAANNSYLPLVAADNHGDASAAEARGSAPIVTIEGGAFRGLAVSGGYAFRGLPYAAAPTGSLRWRPPQSPAAWDGIRDATQFAPSCPQPQGTTVVGDEDCLYLNVSTPTLRRDADRPVLVWIHGGGWTQGAGRDYDPTKLAAEGSVVVTINYRLGALGFLAHPALASQPGGPSGNYGHMDQQAALRWVQRNIGKFGGDPDNVTIAGESAGALSVLLHLVSDGSRGLFDRAIVESGSFALKQQSLAEGEAFGQTFATSAGCSDQSAACLRSLSVATLVSKFCPNAACAAIPGIIDGKVLKESFGTALAAGRFARVPVLNGVNHDEQRVFVTLLHVTVTRGTFIAIPEPITAESYQRVIAAVLGVSASRAASIAAEYPVAAYLSPEIAFSTLDNDSWWACPALQMDQWLAKRVPTFAYEFNDDNAPARPIPQTNPPVATHTFELGYLFDLPTAPFQTPLSPDQETLAATMRAAWANFAASGDPSSAAVRWPSFHSSRDVLSLVPPQPQVETDFASKHHCSFWSAQ